MSNTDDSMGDLDVPSHFHQFTPDDQVSNSQFVRPGDTEEDHVVASSPGPVTDSPSDQYQPDPVLDLDADDLPLLTREHRQILQGDSGISSAMLRDAGVQSITPENLALLVELGFSPKQQVPGILFPHLTVWGERRGHSLRRDEPLDKRKYEIPFGQPNTIYVPPSMLPYLENPEEPLYITEGIKKVLCAVSYGMVCIGLGGVNNWRGRNIFGGKTILPDWHYIALNGRTVVIVFDNDVMIKPQVRSALDGLTSVLRAREAKVQWTLLPEEV